MSNSPSKGTALMAYTRFSLDRSTPSLWRVTFDNPPINLIDPVMAVELDALLTEIEQDDRLAVVVFDSADREYFLAHFDITADRAPYDALPAARTPFHHWANVLIRLSRSRAVTISALRGRARGAGSEFALATDIRFASREGAVLGQFEVGFAAVPGGGPSTRLPGIVGRGRAFESCSVARTSTGNSPSGTGTSTAPFPTRSSSSSLMRSRSGSPVSTCLRSPISSASSTLRRFPPTTR
jgi:enoyl-CoA hydratase/carnithine racemase